MSECTQLNGLLYDVANGAVLAAFMIVLAGAVYAWYRLFRWAFLC